MRNFYTIAAPIGYVLNQLIISPKHRQVCKLLLLSSFLQLAIASLRYIVTDHGQAENLSSIRRFDNLIVIQASYEATLDGY